MEYVRGFIIPDVAEVHATFQRLLHDIEGLLLEARRYNSPLTGTIARDLADVRLAFRDFNRGLRYAAERGAVNATKGMRDRLDSTRRRPSRESTPALRDLLFAVPLPPVGPYQTGTVGVGVVEELNRATNPFSKGYGTFWRAQEYGTGQGGVPSQVGRILYGSFAKAGGSDPTPPLAQYRGGGGPHPIFISGYQPSFGGDRASGLGTIGHEIQPRHFIRIGADEAAIRWRQEVNAVQARALEELGSIRLGRS